MDLGAGVAVSQRGLAAELAKQAHAAAAAQRRQAPLPSASFACLYRTPPFAALLQLVCRPASCQP